MLTSTVLDTFSAVEERRSVKHYDPSFVMPEADVERLMALTLLSPTSFNIQNWRFVRLQSPEVRAKVRELAWNQTQVTDASLVLLLCADLKAWDKAPQRYWQTAPKEVQDVLVPMIGQFYTGREQVQRDEAMRSVGIAAQTLMLSAKAMGYDSCPMIGFDAEAVAHVINLPQDHVIGMMVVVGKALQPARERGGQLSLRDVMVTDHF